MLKYYVEITDQLERYTSFTVNQFAQRNTMWKRDFRNCIRRFFSSFDCISIGNQMITSAYLFQIAREKSFDYLLIIYMKKFLHADWWKIYEMVEQKELSRITQWGNNCAMNCARALDFENKRFDWPSVSFSFATFLSINLISSFCTQFQLSALISSFCTQKNSSFCTVWD